MHVKLSSWIVKRNYREKKTIIQTLNLIQERILIHNVYILLLTIVIADVEDDYDDDRINLNYDICRNVVKRLFIIGIYIHTHTCMEMSHQARLDNLYFSHSSLIFSVCMDRSITSIYRYRWAVLPLKDLPTVQNFYSFRASSI